MSPVDGRPVKLQGNARESEEAGRGASAGVARCELVYVNGDYSTNSGSRAQPRNLGISGCGIIWAHDCNRKEGALAEEEVTITVRPTGPYRVSGPFKLQDVDGNEFPLPDGWDPERPIALCRCGQSSMKPFCDSKHKELDWCPKATLVE